MTPHNTTDSSAVHRAGQDTPPALYTTWLRGAFHQHNKRPFTKNYFTTATWMTRKINDDKVKNTPLIFIE
jgi:hypothetical protein